MNLILLENQELLEDGAARLGDGRARHIIQVLEAKAGDSIRIGLVDGPMGTGVVNAIGSGGVTLACTFDAVAPPVPKVDLLLALPRPKVMRRLWAHLAVVGVRHVMLTNAEKVERDYFDSHVLTPVGYRPLLIEGVQQARDTRLPIVSIHKRFKVLVEDDLDRLSDAQRRIVAHPDPGAPAVRTTLQEVSTDDRILLAIGPEGGWNDFELDLLRRHRFAPVSLGPRTLTTAACIALLTLVHDAIGVHSTCPAPPTD